MKGNGGGRVGRRDVDPGIGRERKEMGTDMKKDDGDGGSGAR